MMEILERQMHKELLVYLDDILAYARSPLDLAASIEEFLQVMSDRGMKLAIIYRKGL